VALPRGAAPALATSPNARHEAPALTTSPSAHHEARVDVSGLDARHEPRVDRGGLVPEIPGTKKGPNQLDACGRVWTLSGADFQRETGGSAVFQSGPVSPLHGFDCRRLQAEQPAALSC
jgi:hypothetical protein